MPIPDAAAPWSYGELEWPNLDLGRLVADLTRGKVVPSDRAHLDPDLIAEMAPQPRPKGWRPLFGQAGAAQRHLENHEVGAGDLFLFYSWFRGVEKKDGRWKFVSGAADEHILYGWFQVGSVHRAADPVTRQVPGFDMHPHAYDSHSKPNVVYRAADRLQLPELNRHLAGAGVWRRRNTRRVLTEPGNSRSRWLLPGWFHPEGRASVLSYHSDPKRWRRQADQVCLENVYRGQEFVLNLEHYPEAFEWLASLF